MAVALRNPTKRPITILVTHEDAPKVQTPVLALSHDRKTGEVGQRRLSMSLPESITLLGGEERRDLPDYLLKDALAAGLVRVQETPNPESGDKAAEAGTAADDERPRERRRKGA
jgi:hypothetical protein